MISPELLRRYPFFSELNEEQLKIIAMNSEEIDASAGTELFAEGQPADYLYLLIDGSLDLSYKSEEESRPETKKIFLIGEINPGEVFGVSAVLAPYIYTASECTSQPSKVIKMEAAALRNMMEKDPNAGFVFMTQLSKALMERLTHTRIQLAAAWS